jgi:hypothetical protein
MEGHRSQRQGLEWSREGRPEVLQAAVDLQWRYNGTGLRKMEKVAWDEIPANGSLKGIKHLRRRRTRRK